MLIAIGLMLLIKVVILQDHKPKNLQAPPMPTAAEQQISSTDPSVPDLSVFDMPDQPQVIKNKIVLDVQPKPDPKPVKVEKGDRPKIVIIIDDMGVSVKNSRDVVALPSPLTLAYLPYANNLDKMTQNAQKEGHELMIHIPMEAMNGEMDLGGVKLTSDMGAQEMHAELNEKVFTAFEGYKGVNNHMGSRLTQDADAMALVMKHLKERGLYFVDSRTINTSVAADVAAEMDVEVAVRDVFLDHYTERGEIDKALAKLERVARNNGVAIGIGHPKPNTVAALKAWLPTLENKGFELVPASAVVQ